MGNEPFRIAIVGSGPRGMSVLERLAARLRAQPPSSLVEVHLIDAVQVGCGRIWRTDQPEWFLMNTIAGEITAFSGPPDRGPTRPGAGPSFMQWWEATEPGSCRANDYAPRSIYGRYLLHLLDAVEHSLPTQVSLLRRKARVLSLRPESGRYRLRFSDGDELVVDRAVLVTGHSQSLLDGHLRALDSYAAKHSYVRFVAGDSAADMDLDSIPPGSKVGVIGMGLTFYDVMAALTIGRGGRFIESAGELVYEPSGREPTIVSGSRSGMPQPARGRNQKPLDYHYEPVFFTAEQVRADAAHQRIDFRRDVLPRLMADVNVVYYSTLLRHRQGPAAEAAFGTALRTAATRASARHDADVVPKICARFGLADAPPVDFDTLALPFAGRTFAHRRDFDQALTAAIHDDLREAVRGNVDSPVKAALDVLRSFRWTIRDLVDFGGLAPLSHQRDLVEWYASRSAFLAAGPPLLRLRQVLALRQADVLRVIGPSARFDIAHAEGRFVVSSPAVLGASVAVDTIVDARIPMPHLPSNASPLAAGLREDGLWTEFVNSDGVTSFATGGVDVTRAPFHPRGRDGNPHRGLYVLGIPSEHVRWFTQVVATGPSRWSEFMADADAVAADLASSCEQIQHVTLPTGRGR